MDHRKHRPLSVSQEEPADMELASALVARFERHADGEEDGSPWWHGWSIHRAFLIGLRLGREEGKREGEQLPLALSREEPSDMVLACATELRGIKQALAGKRKGGGDG